MSGKESSVAPKERINVTFKPSNGEGLDAGRDRERFITNIKS